MPRLVSDIVREILPGSDFEQLDGDSVAELLHGVVQPSPVELILVNCARRDLAELKKAIQELPRTIVVAIVDDGERGIVYELSNRTTFVGPLSREVVVAAVREATS
jgi:hypothetical protein